jgi:hypothetical protein
MNERIKELAEQAKGFVDLNQHVGGEKGCMVYTYDGLEKFAELIVEECARLSVEGDHRISPRNRIIDHFGIKHEG